MSSSSNSVNDESPIEEFPTELLETVEDVLDYKFKNRNLLEAAMTHPSVADADSYLHLKFIGGAALRLALSNHHCLKYTDLHPAQLSRLRDVNLGTEKLACVAVRYGLERCICHNSPRLCGKWVDKFVSEVHMLDQKEPLRGMMQAPQVLADIVESLAGAIYIDDDLNLSTVWVAMSGLLEPLVTLDMLDQLPQPPTKHIEINEILCKLEACAKSAAAFLLEKRKASGPAGGLSALLVKKRKVFATAPFAPPPALTPPPSRRSDRCRGKGVKAAELETELQQMKARVKKLEAELSTAQKACRDAEAAIKAKEEKLAREMASREVEIATAWRVAENRALEMYGDEIVGVVNQYYFDGHIRALTLAGVKPRDPLWYNVEFPFEGTTPELKFPWEAEGAPGGQPRSAPTVEISD